MEIELTKEEKSAIAALKRLAARWPKSLWIYSGDGGAHVLKTLPDGSHATDREGAADQRYVVGSVPPRLHIDSGTW